MVPSFGLIARFFGLSSLPCAGKAVSLAQNNYKSPSKNRKTCLVTTASRTCLHRAKWLEARNFFANPRKKRAALRPPSKDF
jgi:hypothetical protein